MISIGCSGWAYKDWKGLFYPEDLPSKEYLSYYARFFNSVEVNATFYRLPTEKAVRSWHDQVPKEFTFSLKASRYITHIKRFKEVKEPLNRLYGLSDILAEKMGCFLFQFPETLGFKPEILKNLITQLNPRYQNIVEFRNKEWWAPQVIQTLETAHIGFCTISGFGLPEDMIVTHNQIYLRFHGDPPYSSLYSEKALRQWSEKIKSSSLTKVWTYFNNDHNAYAVRNALQLKDYLKT